MKIVVCVKQVPDTAEVKLDREKNTLIRDGVPSIINPYDRHAIEAALSIKEQAGGGTVTAISMGPPQAEAALREAIELGVDEGVLLTDRAFAGSDTLATSRALAAMISIISPDVIFCGKQAIDGDTAQVGPEVAEFLGIPHVAYVRKIVTVSDGAIRVERLMDDGYDVVDTSLPVLFTAVKELNTPRLPSLRGKMAAKKAVIKKITAADLSIPEGELGLSGSPTQVNRVFTPEARGGRKALSGSLEEQVSALAGELRAMSCA
ncbi:MAG: electron transfer flavoprotein subunit beta/FixA family protein [Nitrospirae bacterium]|nr:electron transfer flavoprotein subunit beta/FixA family protein [Nitrospirota bacterium]